MVHKLKKDANYSISEFDEMHTMVRILQVPCYCCAIYVMNMVLNSPSYTLNVGVLTFIF